MIFIIIYTVKPGDSVYSLAEEYRISPFDIISGNGLKPPYSLVVGQSLVLSYVYDRQKTISSLGYAYPFAEQSVLERAMQTVMYLSPFTYGFTLTGDIINLDDYQIRETAFSQNKKCLMHLSTLTEEGGFSSEQGSELLNTRTVWETLKNNIIEIIREKNFSGIDVDFEYLPREDYMNYADFISYLRENLNPLGYMVVVAVSPKTSDSQPGDFYESHNYYLLGQAANYVFVMTYEWGYTYGPPQAVSPITGVTNVLKYALTRIPPEKILLGISNYAYDWTLPYVQGKSRAVLIGNEEAVRIADEVGTEIIFDPVSKSPYFNYYKDGNLHTVWFEDARSIFERLKLVEDYNLRGIGIWNLMRPFAALYNLIYSMFYQDFLEIN